MKTLIITTALIMVTAPAFAWVDGYQPYQPYDAGERPTYTRPTQPVYTPPPAPVYNPPAPDYSRPIDNGRRDAPGSAGGLSGRGF